jgi:hypothetical protein
MKTNSFSVILMDGIYAYRLSSRMMELTKLDYITHMHELIYLHVKEIDEIMLTS